MFKIFVKIALLNTLRNKRRTITTMLSIIFGVSSLIVFGGYFVGLFDGLRESMIRSEIGHIQIYKKGYTEFGQINPEKYVLSKKEVEEVSEILEEVEEIAVFTTRLKFTGLISNGSNSFGILGTGVESDKESILSSFLRVEKGEILTDEDEEGIMIGDILARNLNTKIGDYLTILGSTVDGAVNAIDGKVVGIVKSGFDQMDSRLVQGNLKLAQGFKDSSDVTSMVILLEETEDTVRIQNLIEKKIKEKGLEVEILRWDQISDLYNKVTSLFTTIYQFINIIVVVIVLFTVSNTVSMNIMERINEIGTMRALGTTKFQIVFLFVLESFFLGLAGCIFGVIIGYVASEWINLLHIKLPPPPTRNEEYIVYIMFDLAIYLKTGFIILISMLSGLLASMRGVKFKIVDALRYV